MKKEAATTTEVIQLPIGKANKPLGPVPTSKGK